LYDGDGNEGGDVDTAAERRWALLGVLATTLIAFVDLALGEGRVFVTAVVVGPALATEACRPVVTGVVALYALVTAVLVGHFGEDLLGYDELVRYTAVAVVGAALVLASARRTERERRLAEVTRVAEVAQRTILRSLPASLGPFSFAARYVSASHEALVGGDFYDACETEHGVRAIVGDVRGKGLDAVQLAADVLGAFRAAAHLDSVDDVVHAVDSAVRRAVDAEDFVTAVSVQFNDDGTVCIVNCGHPAPLIVGPDGARFVDEGRTRPLGLNPEVPNHIEPFRPDERLLLYTDGLIEARDRRGDFFPLERSACVALDCDGSLDEALDRLLAQLVDHAGGHVKDDVAVLVTQAG
jgi:serine phosphatase RsbU (regulator of sigma subunit)